MKKMVFNKMNEIAGLLMPRRKFNHFVSICRHDEKRMYCMYTILDNRPI